MASGHIVNGSCVDVAVSLDAYYSAGVPAITAGAPAYLTQFEKDTSGWNLVTYADGVLYSSVSAVPPSFVSCDTTSAFFDGLELGWMVVAAMVAAWAVMALRGALIR